MSSKMLVFMVSLLSMFLLTSCGSKTDIVDSGTYAGTIKKVEPEKREIYVTLEDEKLIELYFIDETILTKNGQPVDFSELTAGQKVSVTVKRTGNRLDPTAVDILD